MVVNADLVDDPFFEVLARLPECLCDELTKAGGPTLCYCGLWVGTDMPPLGYMDCEGGKPCGAAWVRLDSSFPSAQFPVPDIDTGPVAATCAAPLAYQVEIGVARCAPRPKGRDLFPDAQAMFEAQRLYMSDLRAMKQAVLCCFPREVQKDLGKKIAVALGTYVPLPNMSGISGGTWSAFLAVA